MDFVIKSAFSSKAVHNRTEITQYRPMQRDTELLITLKK